MPVSAAFLLVETAVIVIVWIMIQLEANLTPLLVTVLQLTEQFNHQDSSIKFCTLGTENCHVYQCKSASMLIFVDFLPDFFWPNRILQ